MTMRTVLARHLRAAWVSRVWDVMAEHNVGIGGSPGRGVRTVAPNVINARAKLLDSGNRGF
eukprot:COSAG05_NODE_1293_length_5260_cov_2.373571_3_plen_61_part_00